MTLQPQAPERSRADEPDGSPAYSVRVEVARPPLDRSRHGGRSQAPTLRRFARLFLGEVAVRTASALASSTRRFLSAADAILPPGREDAADDEYFIRQDDSAEFFDELAESRLGISGSTFVERWHSGFYEDGDRDPDVDFVGMHLNLVE